MGQDGGGGGGSPDVCVCVCVCVLQPVTQFHREQAVVLAWEKMHLSRKDFCEGVKKLASLSVKNPLFISTMRTHILVILFPMMYNEVWKILFSNTFAHITQLWV